MIAGFNDHHEVTRLIGVLPSEAWNSGDVYIVNNKTMRRPRSFWSYGKVKAEEIDENKQLEMVLSDLSPFFENIKKTPAIWEKKIVMVHKTESCNADLIIPRKIVDTASAIGASFWIDIYCGEAPRSNQP